MDKMFNEKIMNMTKTKKYKMLLIYNPWRRRNHLGENRSFTLFPENTVLFIHTWDKQTEHVI
jgi:hypothetical protein